MAFSNVRLFLSVDIVGSTEFKAKTANKKDNANRQLWLSVFELFHLEFRNYFMSSTFPDIKNKFLFWKALGDELLFYVEIDNLDTLFCTLTVFEKAIRTYREEEKNNYKNQNLSLKGTAWIAGFPYINSKIELENGAVKHSDFIGPTIDAGFRVSKFSTSNHLCLNAELAYILLECLKRRRLNEDFKDQEGLQSLENRLYFHGLEQLKGVVDGRPYPIFFIEQNTSTQTHFDRMMGISAVDPVTAFEYIEAFFSEVDSDHSFCRPYILNADGAPVYGNMPDCHRQPLTSIGPDLIPTGEEIALQQESQKSIDRIPIDLSKLPPNLEKPPTTSWSD